MRKKKNHFGCCVKNRLSRAKAGTFQKATSENPKDVNILGSEVVEIMKKGKDVGVFWEESHCNLLLDCKWYRKGIKTPKRRNHECGEMK